jgi:hypothetical protein
LEDYGAMWIDWKTKIFKFQHNGKDVVLHGVVDDTSTCPSVSSHGLKGLLKRSALSHYMKLMPILVDPKKFNWTCTCCGTEGHSCLDPRDVAEIWSPNVWSSVASS